MNQKELNQVEKISKQLSTIIIDFGKINITPEEFNDLSEKLTDVKEYIANMKSNALTECPKCGHDYIYDIGHDNWTCGNDNCNHVFKLKSNL